MAFVVTDNCINCKYMVYHGMNIDYLAVPSSKVHRQKSSIS